MDLESRGLLNSINNALVSLDRKFDKVAEELKDHRISDEGNFAMLQSGQSTLAEAIKEIKQARKDESDRRQATIRAQADKKDAWALAKSIAKWSVITAITAAFVGAWATSYFESRSHKKAIDELKVQVMDTNHKPH